MKINTDSIRKIIHTEYGFPILSIEPLNLGYDANTMVFKILSSGQQAYFLKIRSKYFSVSCNILFWLSQNAGLTNIINPIETLDKKLYVKTPSAYFMVYPYINGKSGLDLALTKDQFIEFGRFLKKLHSEKIPNRYFETIPADNCGDQYIEMTKNIGMIKKYLKSHKKILREDNIILDFFAALETYQNKISEIISYLENTVNEISCKNLCVCHGDIHAGNLLIDKNNFYVVDWDTMILAPKEKDLMYIGGGIGSKWTKDADIENFYKGYGREDEVNKNLLKYYRCKRIIRDIYYFTGKITDIKYENEKRSDCLIMFKNLFEPGNAAEMALKA